MAFRAHVMIVVYSRKKGDCTLLVEVQVSSNTGRSTVNVNGVFWVFDNVPPVTEAGRVQLTLEQLWILSWLPALPEANLLKMRLIVSAPGGAIFHQYVTPAGAVPLERPLTEGDSPR